MLFQVFLRKKMKIIDILVYYLHPDEHYIKEEHSYPLVVGLTPVVDVVHIKVFILEIVQKI